MRLGWLVPSSVPGVTKEVEELTGGNAAENVVRIGGTVRDPWLENSAVVQDCLVTASF